MLSFQSDGTSQNIRANYFDGIAWGTAELKPMPASSPRGLGNGEVPKIQFFFWAPAYKTMNDSLSPRPELQRD